MELDPLDRQLTVPEPHDQSIGGLSCHLECRRQRGAVDDQRVVAGHFERVVQPGEDTSTIVGDLRTLAVNDFRSTHHVSAENLADALKSQTNPQNRSAGTPGADDLVRRRDLGRMAWAGADEDAVRVDPLDVFHRDGPVAVNHRIGAQLPDVLDEVVNEGIEVVDHEDSGAHIGSVELRATLSRTRSVYPLAMAKAGKRRTEEGTTTTTSGRVTPPKASKGEQSSRYTAKGTSSVKAGPSPRWVPVLMFGLWIVGLLVIILNYMGVLPGADSGNGWYLVAGLVAMLGGIMVATQYR